MKQFMSTPQSNHSHPHGEAFGLRWQSAATTPHLKDAPGWPKRRGASLPAAVQMAVWNSCRFVFIRGFFIGPSSARARARLLPER